ncbi:response regulator [Methanoregula sp.]|uniref:response regulator n=1 Tax=Methanoregula sp. TaxID=2052170 RepID=UPI00236A8E3A|nr:response regulator [Methanoregula sp.]MDD1685359.1 response regulator [Methanoregula sp.]
MISVLYVDDDPALRDLGKIFLEKIGNFSVETCNSGPEALERLEQVSYHAVLSDYDMPEMNGIQFLKEVRSRYPTLPFIIFTGRGREDVVVEALNNGVDFYLQKGGEPKSQFAELSHKLRAAVQRRQSAEQIKHLARLYAVLSRTNEAAAYIRDRTALLAEVCQIAVRDGGFLMVWAGLIGSEPDSFEAVAHCSSVGDPSLPPSEPGEILPLDAPPTRVAITEGRYNVIADTREDPQFAPWKDRVSVSGFRSSAAFPLRVGERVIGAMTFYAREPRFFDEEEVQLLLELTDNISIALELMEREQDITELKQMGNALRSANNKLNLLNNIIRHDILNTVAGLLGLEDMALDIIDNREARELLSEIKGSTRKIQEQITFTREYQTIGVQSPQWQNVVEVVERAGAQVDHRDIAIVINVPDTEIYADPLFEKAVYNLLDNAIRYGETISTIRFHTQDIPDGHILICEDDGIGVADHLKERIFEQGYGKHTGQGLFLVREILSITGISISENGSPGKGARFEMVVPRNGSRMTIRSNEEVALPTGTGSDHAVIMR